ncbi:PhzF family phenazine biosynthesis protein [Shewanella sp. AS16]|uniref:PhzF family phenazine biosynthesis protein n=1 Tax=Shewanella sp. AS16 TaxID=2907625 RepID=UPI001F1650EB|nr:PhzF family phenazine biosynthesis protein [Shewanella sp. AS16]MCE9685999.1 PhzF family phenazine biosynthesis protein [Shewanella sp. AS16]
MKCKLVDVFTNTRLTGNGLTIFYDFDELTAAQMQALTREMRQFESIFLTAVDGRYRAKIFTVEEELDFAGHPLIGLAYHLHEEFGAAPAHQWSVELNHTSVLLTSSVTEGAFSATMAQGRPDFIKTLSPEEASVLYGALNLGEAHRTSQAAEAISTGLPYIILPVTHGLEDIEFKVANLEPLLEKHGAKFLYALDINSLEGRTWDNCGKVEDVATGSAAGPVAAYLHKHALLESNELIIRQGRFVGRPSEIAVSLECDANGISKINVSGNVVKVADMHLV